ncbi:FGGY-family carbohydrate kinase [Lyngbya confervoides]|uniref:FGGY-family carbohydrate kinase n=1 Tax=Lyngbya confervoides BDU141951 TaxID=1574623 RepID=A0ABD4T4F0_9CYAN|nr:FGGY-family carbohydrate kinase [Lyngbya confervoides]MCM1983348.1 FGGY-family carbohydrate kinase [Lyngbya confervoides BDU141951]
MYYLGIDFGTSGARSAVIDETDQLCWQQSIPFPSPMASGPAQRWRTTLFQLIQAIPPRYKAAIARIAINGTSATVLLCDETGTPLTEPLMYSDRCPPDSLAPLANIAPAGHLVLSPSSSLAKLLSWRSHPLFPQARFLLHQADWIAAQLHGRWGISDYHNCLKLGYDPAQRAYPNWFDHDFIAPLRSLLPQALTPGTVVGPPQATLARHLGLPSQTEICAGTTDSIAAFLASPAQGPGEAVTSLGSTLVIKLLSQTRIDQFESGIYSHWFGSAWLVGGASNTGGAVLAHFFTPTELTTLSLQIDPQQNLDLNYYPLLKPGERFPIQDPDLEPRLPSPEADPVTVLQGLLQSMARIEAEGYGKLQALGANPLLRVYTAGGGAQNAAWTVLRQQALGVPVLAAPQTEAAYGTARLARGYFSQQASSFPESLSKMD